MVLHCQCPHAQGLLLVSGFIDVLDAEPERLQSTLSIGVQCAQHARHQYKDCYPVRLQANGSRGEAYTFYVRAVAVELVLKQPLMYCPNFYSVWCSVFMYSVSSSALLSRVRRHAYAGVSVIILSARGIVHSA